MIDQNSFGVNVEKVMTGLDGLEWIGCDGWGVREAIILEKLFECKFLSQLKIFGNCHALL